MSEKLDVSYSLTEEEKRIFRKFKRSNSAKLTKSEFQTMLRSKLVDGGFGGEYYLAMAPLMRELLAYRKTVCALKPPCGPRRS